MRGRTTYIFFLLVFTISAYSQSGLNAALQPSDSLNTARRNTVIISEAVLATGSLIALNELWYSDFDRSKFHVVNDANEWLQMDKLGHVYSGYQLGRIGSETLRWSGVSKRDRLLYGSTLGFSYLTAVEILDGFSTEWGFSWSDMGAKAIGTALYAGQELLWNEQRVLLKYSFHTTRFANQRPDKLGENFLEQVLKDYNGQTYWLSLNLRYFFKNSQIPPWLNLALGYSASGMLTGRNEGIDGLFPDQDRYRQYYLSLDVDLTRIRTNSHVLKTLFSVVNVLKFPFPALEINSGKKAVFHLLFY